MKTIEVEVCLSIGYSTAKHEDILFIDVEDNATSQEIENEAQEAAQEWATNFIDIGYQINHNA